MVTRDRAFIHNRSQRHSHSCSYNSLHGNGNNCWLRRNSNIYGYCFSESRNYSKLTNYLRRRLSNTYGFRRNDLYVVTCYGIIFHHRSQCNGNTCGNYRLYRNGNHSRLFSDSYCYSYSNSKPCNNS